ncbi:streptomycin 3'-adenylyltransferase [Virgibacillus halotolerans]|uniref:aminoglycoside adenylyltransferase domain-containing protein n=1 Tax=Virgibacillus halotolerans TaxID=1071053 RepID=UPI0019610415|nr:aminoglycoside adenylyltransferase domain-containing protein [Virgibacillus halotolerans]MBM7599587.1 streptomycin 3'-adenylyltransferase [Virgibacillus halotolerans]
MNRPQIWTNCDEDIRQFIERLIDRLASVLGTQLVGVYLHGSLAIGSYYRSKSDIDLIVVVAHPLEYTAAERVGLLIANEAFSRPTTGNVELSVITAKAAKQAQMFTPFEVHYSSDWHEKVINHHIDYTIEQTDSDLVSHLTYVVQRGICLHGASIQNVFGKVEWHLFMDSVLDDLAWILENEHILEAPFYGVLNICRVLQLLHVKTETVHSKDEGGEWGLKHLPQDYHPLIRQALHVYRSSEKVNEDKIKSGGVKWNQTALRTLRDYARLKIDEQ